MVLGIQSERGVGLGWNWEKLTLNAFQLASTRMDEKFERVGSLKMCVREGKWRNVTELKKNEDKGAEESRERRWGKWILVKKWVDEKKRGKKN